MTEARVDPVPRICLDPKEAAVSLGVSLSTFRRHIMPGLKGIAAGNCRLFHVDELSKWAQESGTLMGTSEP